MEIIKCHVDGSTIGDGCAICKAIGQHRCPDHYHQIPVARLPGEPWGKKAALARGETKPIAQR